MRVPFGLLLKWQKNPHREKNPVAWLMKQSFGVFHILQSKHSYCPCSLQVSLARGLARGFAYLTSRWNGNWPCQVLPFFQPCKPHTTAAFSGLGFKLAHVPLPETPLKLRCNGKTKWMWSYRQNHTARRHTVRNTSFNFFSLYRGIWTAGWDSAESLLEKVIWVDNVLSPSAARS